MKLSICIPTYNRAKHLSNCLESIKSNRNRAYHDYEVCISNNCSTDNTETIVDKARSTLNIKYSNNESNYGIPRNYLRVLEMAEGDFVWLIGDDELLLPDAIDRLLDLLESHTNVDYFFVNSYHLSTEYVFSYPQPFSTANLPEKMEPFSKWKKSGYIMFMDLIDPDIAFDYLGGMYLSVFKRNMWKMNTRVLDEDAIHDTRTFSHYDNTFPHVKIFAHAFAKSQAYINVEALSVNLTGAREWSPMYPFVHSVRLIESLDEYRKCGLPYGQYIKCKNFALNNFIPDMANMYLNRNESGYRYINPLSLIMNNLLYPNMYLSALYYFNRKIRSYVYGKVNISKAGDDK